MRRNRRDEVRALRALERTGVDPVLAESFADREKKESTTSNAPPSGAMVQRRGSHQITEAWTRVDRPYTAIPTGGSPRATISPRAASTAPAPGARVSSSSTRRSSFRRS
jgi:hypothetical protein